ncbi:unnamed protein product [Urochloa humidicola]
MADEVKIQIEEGHPLSVVDGVPTEHKDPEQASSSSSAETERTAMETERPSSGTPAPEAKDFWVILEHARRRLTTNVDPKKNEVQKLGEGLGPEWPVLVGPVHIRA